MHVSVVMAIMEKFVYGNAKDNNTHGAVGIADEGTGMAKSVWYYWFDIGPAMADVEDKPSGKEYISI